MLLFVHGYDAPGVGASIAKILFEKNCHIENLKIISMGGFFSMMLYVDSKGYLDKSDLEESVRQALTPFDVNIKACDDGLPSKCLEHQKEEWIPYEVKIVCEEQTKTLYCFLKEMSNLRINVADIHCHRLGSDANQSYQIVSRTEIPVHVPLEIVKSSLEVLKRNLNILVDIHPVEDLEM